MTATRVNPRPASTNAAGGIGRTRWKWLLTDLKSSECPGRLVEVAGSGRADEYFGECERTGGERIVDLPSSQRFGRLLVGVVGVEVRDEDAGSRSDRCPVSAWQTAGAGPAAAPW